MGVSSADTLTHVWEPFPNQVLSCALASAGRFAVLLFQVVTSRNIYRREQRGHIREDNIIIMCVVLLILMNQSSSVLRKACCFLSPRRRTKPTVSNGNAERVRPIRADAVPLEVNAF